MKGVYWGEVALILLQSMQNNRRDHQAVDRWHDLRERKMGKERKGGGGEREREKGRMTLPISCMMTVHLVYASTKPFLKPIF